MRMNKKVRDLLTPDAFKGLVQDTMAIISERFGEDESLFLPMLKQLLFEVPEFTEIGVITLKFFDDGRHEDLIDKLILISNYVNNRKCTKEEAEKALGRKL